MEIVLGRILLNLLANVFALILNELMTRGMGLKSFTLLSFSFLGLRYKAQIDLVYTYLHQSYSFLETHLTIGPP